MSDKSLTLKFYFNSLLQELEVFYSLGKKSKKIKVDS